MNNYSKKKFNKSHHTGKETHLLRGIVRTYQVIMTGFSRKMGMPVSRVTLIRLLAIAEEEVGIMDLSRRLGINAAAVTRQVKELEAEGIVRRRADSRDGRRSYIRLSPKGRRLFAAIHDRGHELEEKLSSVISIEEMKATVAVLEKLRGFIENM